MIRHLFLVAALTLSGLSPAVAAQSPVPADRAHAGGTAALLLAATRTKPILIVNDKGGNVMAAVQRRAELEASGRPVEIRGYCRSACTLYLTMRNACLGPNAIVGFHAPRLPGTRIIPPLVDQIMAAHYRNGVLRKWNAEWRHDLNMTKLKARQVKALDPQIRLCAR